MDNLTADEDFFFVYSCPNDVVCLLEVVVVILVSSLILLSNTINLVVVLSTPSFRNSHGYLLISLSLADFVVGCVASLSIYPSATLSGSTDAWPYGDTVCLIAAYVGQLALMNSGLGLMLLSIERYIAVAHPLKYARLMTKKITAIAIALCWLVTASALSAVFAGPPSDSYAPQIYVCQSLLRESSVYALVLVFAAALPSVTVMLVTTAIVNRKLKESARLRAAMVPAFTPSTSQDSNLPAGTSKKAVRLSRTIRLMTFAVIFHMFPYLIVIIISILGTEVPQVISFATYWWLISNSFINSIIYYLKTTKYRERLHEIAGRLYPRCFREIDERIWCTCRCRKRQHTLPSQCENPGSLTVDLVAIREKQRNGIKNDGFQESKTSMTKNQTDESQTAVYQL